MADMTTSDWIDLFSAAANTLLLATTIAGVWFAWRAHCKQMRLQQFTDYTKRYQDIIRDFPEDVNEPEFVLDKDTGTEPGHARFEKTMRAMRAYFDLCYEEWELHDRKDIDEHTWAIWSGGMATAFKKPAFQQAWARVTRPHDTDYGPRFKQFVDSLIAEARSCNA
jgi:hypothetical protein